MMQLTQPINPLVHKLMYSLSIYRKSSIEMIIIRKIVVLSRLDTEMTEVVIEGGGKKEIRRSGGQRVTHLRKVG